MANHPNRGWRSRWSVAGNQASHGPSGLGVAFRRNETHGAWDGAAVNAGEVAAALAATGTQNLERTFARLMREAGEIFSEKQNDT